MNYFLDTEFNEWRGHLISIALVRQDMKTVYCEFAPSEPYGPWVSKNVVRKLDMEFVTHHDAQVKLAELFNGDTAPRVYCDWPTDIQWLCWLADLGGGNRILPRRVEFILSPDEVSSDASIVPHHALHDALAMYRQFYKLPQPTAPG